MGGGWTKTSYYRKLYHYRHRIRGGLKKAMVVAQHAIPTAIWHMLSTGTFPEDLGPDHFQRDKARHHSAASSSWASMYRWRRRLPDPGNGPTRHDSRHKETPAT